jgi:Ca2+-binding RTX toxin-like protein
MEVVMMRRSNRLLMAVAVTIGAALGATAPLSAVDFPLRKVVDVVDFDRDGQVDVLVSPNESRPLYLVRQVNGSYSQEFQLSNANSLGELVAASDFNGDGFVDVAWADNLGTEIYLAAGSRAGVAPLTSPILQATITSGLNGLTAADLTRDGKGDLLATGTGGVYLFAGPLSPSSSAPSPLSGSPSNARKAIVVSRGEARPDVYVATAAGVVRMSSDTSGTWRFSPALSAPAQDFAVGDANGDGLPDLVTIEPPSSGSPRPMQVLLRLATASGGFGSPEMIAQGTDLRAVAIGDADGIERSDVLYAQNRPGSGSITNELFLLAGRDEGGFYGAESVGANFPGSQEYLRLVDLDGKRPAEVVFSGNPSGVRSGAGQVQTSRPNLVVSAPRSSSVVRGATLALPVSIENTGARDATGATLQLALPPGLAPSETPPECVAASPGLSCRLGTVASGTTRQVRIGVLAQTAGNVTLSLKTRASEADVNSADNDLTVSVDITVSQSPPDKGVKRRGTAKADTMRGTPYADVLDGLAGADRIFGNAGSDILIGGAGKDTIDAGKGADRLFGNAAGDMLVGGAGKDTIDAGKGNDTIRARDKTRDVILCGAGTDTVVADKADVVVGCEKVVRR